MSPKENDATTKNGNFSCTVWLKNYNLKAQIDQKNKFLNNKNCTFASTPSTNPMTKTALEVAGGRERVLRLDTSKLRIHFKGP